MSETAKHTPGPWRTTRKAETEPDHIDGYTPFVFGADGKKVADLSYADPPTGSIENQANARLIAKAPELLAAMRQLHETHMIGGGSPGIPVPEEFGVDGVAELLAYIDGTPSGEASDGAGESERVRG